MCETVAAVALGTGRPRRARFCVACATCLHLWQRRVDDAKARPATAAPSMTGLDWVIVAFTALMAVYGYAQGFLVGALSLVGFVGGAFLGTRLGPLLLPDGAESPYAPIFGLMGALFAGAVLATGLEGLALALRRRVRAPGLEILDGALGAALTACVALGVAWIGGAVALQSSKDPEVRRAVQRSAVLRRAQRGAAAIGIDPQRAVADRPLPQLLGAGGRPAPAQLGDRTRPAGQGGRARRRADPRHRVRAGHRGIGLGRAPGRGGDQRPRRRGHR